VQVVVRLITTCQTSLFEQRRDTCSTRPRLIVPMGISLECGYKRGRSRAGMELAQVQDGFL
jgi:hypothetical protein